MKPCKFRIAVDKSEGKNAGVEVAMDKATRGMGMFGNIAVGQLRQSFDCGLCELLTQTDIGPMECQQPEHDEMSCPDIAHLRTKEG